jgi:site-specific DNA recombinase
MGYEVVRVFCDRAISGNIVDRPALQELVSYVGRGRPEPFSIIVENVLRLGRSQQAFAAFCAAIKDAGGGPIVFVDS